MAVMRTSADGLATPADEVGLGFTRASEAEHAPLDDADTPLGATPFEELFEQLLDDLREPLAFDDALFLRPDQREGSLVVDASTDPLLVGTRFPLGPTLWRALGGEVTTHAEASAVPEWIAQPEELRTRVATALLMPLQGDAGPALLVLTRRDARSFGARDEEVARLLRPLASRAVRDAERALALGQRNEDLRTVLDNVAQGLLMVGRDRTVVGARSALIERWFGPIAPGARLDDVLRAKAPEIVEWLDIAWDALIDSIMPLELLLTQLPQQIPLGDRVLRLEYRPVPNPDVWTHLLVVFSDVTVELQRERAEARSREFAAMVSGFMRDRRGFESFLRETDQIVRSLIEGGLSASKQFRALHTLKGNASLLALSSFASIVHELEDRARHEPLPGPAFTPLVEALEGIRLDLEPLRGESSGVEVDARELELLVEGLRGRVDPEVLLERVLSWRTEPVARGLKRLAAQARAAAARLGKGEISVEVDADEVHLEGETWRAFFSNLVHAVRNAVDHGLESPSERIAAGKPAAGRLILRARRNAESLTISVMDDGRGIPWAEVAARARDQGLSAGTHEELVECLFRDGFSTADKVTEVSGRGVGLAALRAATRDRGGRLDVTSEPGRGATFSFVFPDHAYRHRRGLQATAGGDRAEAGEHGAIATS